MSETLDRVGLDALLGEAHRVADALQALDLTRYGDDEVLGALRSFETLRRRLEPVTP